MPLDICRHRFKMTEFNGVTAAVASQRFQFGRKIDQFGQRHLCTDDHFAIARIGAGSVLGEQSFFDNQPRSATVWAVTEGTLLLLSFDSFSKFGEAEPALARDFLFAMGRVLSIRLRNTSFRLRR